MTNTEKHVCSFCRNTGTNGAEWLIKEPGSEDRKVHKPCGEKALAGAPKGTQAKLMPSLELKAKWHAERDERATRSFWAEKFAQARPLA